MRRWLPPPVPPLGDAAMSRIERGVFAALDVRAPSAAPRGGRRRRLVAFGLAGAAAASAGVLFGARTWRRDDALASRPAQISTTTSGSHVAISGATLDVAPESAVSFGGGREGAVVVALERGAVTCEVAPRSNRAPFIVEAGATRVTVIGTRFTVRRVGEHATVSVEHGLVEVADTNMTELVHAGERFRPGEPVTVEPIASEAPPAAADAPSAAPSSVIGRALAAAAPSSAAGTVAAARPPGHRAHAARLARADAGDTERAASGVTGRQEAAVVEAASVDAPETSPSNGALTLPPERAPAARSGAQRGSAQVLFELAAQLEVRDPVSALRIYGELATGEDAWAASALFASARLEAEGGQVSGARAACEEYLRRFPRGDNTDDARTLLATLH